MQLIDNCTVRGDSAVKRRLDPPALGLPLPAFCYGKKTRYLKKDNMPANLKRQAKTAKSNARTAALKKRRLAVRASNQAKGAGGGPVKKKVKALGY